MSLTKLITPEWLRFTSCPFRIFITAISFSSMGSFKQIQQHNHKKKMSSTAPPKAAAGSLLNLLLLTRGINLEWLWLQSCPFGIYLTVMFFCFLGIFRQIRPHNHKKMWVQQHQQQMLQAVCWIYCSSLEAQILNYFDSRASLLEYPSQWCSSALGEFSDKSDSKITKNVSSTTPPKHAAGSLLNFLLLPRGINPEWLWFKSCPFTIPLTVMSLSIVGIFRLIRQ